MLMCLWRGRSTPAIRAIVSLPSAAKAALRYVLTARRKSRLFQSLALALFMFRNHANHPHHTLAVDDLALVANFLNRCAYFHKSPAFSRQLSAFSKTFTCICTQFFRDSGRMEKAPRPLCLPAECG